MPQTTTPGDTSNFERYPASPLEDLPAALRAQQARQYSMNPDLIEKGPDPCKALLKYIRHLASMLTRPSLISTRWIPLPSFLILTHTFSPQLPPYIPFSLPICSSWTVVLFNPHSMLLHYLLLFHSLIVSFS